MQLRRRCRRFCLGRRTVYLLILFATISTTMFVYSFYLNIFFDEQNQRSKVFMIDEKDLKDARIKPTKNIRLLHEDYFNTKRLTCRYPKLMIDDPDIWQAMCTQPIRHFAHNCVKKCSFVFY